MNLNIDKLRIAKNTIQRCSTIFGLCLLITATNFANTTPEFALWVDADATNIICFSDENGTATATPNDGVAPFTYQWSNGENTQTITGLALGEYEVTVTDADGNSDTDITFVFGPNAPMEVNTSSNFATCESSLDGKVNAQAKGGYAPYTYSWEDEAGNTYEGDLVDEILAGTYNLTVTDANGCTVTAEETIQTSPEGIWIMTVATHPHCNGDGDGTAYANAMTGQPPYTYQWSDPAMQTTQTASNLDGGIYFVTVTDANGCSGVEKAKVIEPLPLILTTNITDAECDEDNGMINAFLENGNYPVEFIWSDGQTGSTATELSPGSYSVTVTDEDGCTAALTNLIVEDGCNNPCSFSSSASLEVETSSNFATCDSSLDGKVNAEAEGGQAPYTYSWADESGNNYIGFLVDGILAGTYSLTVTDANGCTVTAEETIQTSPEGIWIMTVVTNLNCNGDGDGTAYANAMTGQPPYTYQWSDSAMQTTQTAVNLGGGTYFVTVTDANGCSGVEQAEVVEPLPLILSTNITAAECDEDNGMINAFLENGNYPVDFIWSDGQMGSTATELSLGSYGVTVTDEDGCTAALTNLTVEDGCISPPCSADAGTLTLDQSSPVCLENGMATISATPNGDQIIPAGYEVWYVLTTTNGLIILDASNATDFNINNPGLYTIHTLIAETSDDTDDNYLDLSLIEFEVTTGDEVIALISAAGICADLDAEGVPFVVQDCNDPCSSPIIESLVIIEPACNENNGSAVISLVGNESDFSYTWTPNVSNSNIAENLSSGIYTVVIQGNSAPDCPIITETFSVANANGPMVEIVSTTPATCNEANGTATISPFGLVYTWCNGETGNNATSLMAGECFVTVTDTVNNCTDVITLFIESTNPLNAEIQVNNQPDCNQSNGALTVMVTNGSSNYSYAWMDGSTDANRTNLPSGFYTVTVTDNGPTGCTRVASIVLVNDVPQASVTLNTPVTTTCVGSDDGMADFDIITEPGFALPANVVITDLDGNTVSNGNLSPGEYCIIVLDANNCVAGGTCFTVSEIPQIDLDLAVLPEGCSPDGSITITDLRGGNGGYTFDWSDLPGNNDPQNRTGLVAGIYNVTVTDAEGCSVAVNGLNVIKDCSCQPPVLESVVVVEATCGNMNGRASVNIAGGSAGYTFSWSGNISSTNTADSLSAGTYTVTITDNTDPTCMLVEIFTVGNSDGPTVEITTTPAECSFANGTATLSPADFTYTWNDGSMESTRDDLNAGLYQVTIVDPASPDCFDVQTIMVEVSNDLTASVTVNNNPEPGMSDGSATIMVDGGSGNYSYSWGPDATRNDLSAGLYAVIVTDLDTGCETRIIFVLNNNSSPSMINVSNIDPVLCAGGNEGQVDFDLDLGPNFAGPERIVIVDGDGNTYQNGELPAGEYCALVYDVNNVLSASTCFTIAPVSQIDLDLAIVDQSCLNPGGIEVVSTIGGSGDYNYEWSANANPGTDPTTLNDLEAGTYSLTLTDSNGCTVSESFDVSDDSYPLQIMLDGMNIECDSVETGAVNSSVTGGEGMLNYIWSNDEETANLSDLSAGTYTVTVTDENGCTGISSTTIEAPTPVIFDLPADTTVCNSPIVISANANVDGLIYTWTDANGSVIGASEQVVLNLSGDNTEILLTVVDSFGCSTMQSLNLMNSAPEVELDDVTTACIGEPTQLSIDNLDPNDTLTYVWEPADAIIDGGDTGNPTINITEPGNTVITGTVTNQFGCTTTVTSTIMVPDLTASIPDSIVSCAGIPAALNNGGNENLVYEWSPAEFLNDPTSPNPFVNAPAGTNELFTVMISDSAGICSNTEMVDFLVPDELTDLEIPADNFICEAGEITLNAGGTGVVTVNYFDDAGLQIGSGEEISLPVSDVSGEVQMITIQYIDEFGCPTTEMVSIGNASFALTVLEEVSTCLGTPINITSQTSLDMGIEFSNQWTPTADIVDAAPDSSDITVNPPADQTYQLVTTNEFGCSQTATAEVMVTDLSDFVISDTDRDTIFRGESAQLTTSENDDFTYLWEPANSLDDNTISNPEATPDETTTYTLTVTDGDGCTTMERITVTVLTPECNKPFIFFPNAFTPNNDGFNDIVYLRAAFSVDEVFFMIYTRWGEKVFESNSIDDGWDGRFKGEALSSDVYAYYLRVRCANGDEYTEKGNITLLK